MNKFPLSLLFIPGNKPEWISKTFDKGADSVILDLEDSVPFGEKEESRESLYAHLSETSYDGTLIVRTNPISEELGQLDISLLTQSELSIDAFMLPKLEEVSLVNELPDINSIALLETPKSIRNLEEIAACSKVKGLALGGADLSASLGSTMGWDSLLFARSKIVLEASIHNLFTIDCPYMDIENLESLEEESRKSKALGFNGKAAIHPSQLQVITKSFLPSDQEIEEAQEIIRAFNRSDAAVIAFNGKMIDNPIIVSLEKRLRLVGIDPKTID